MLFYTMKQKLSITIEESTIKELNRFLEQRRFRNKSHIIEYSINKFLEEEKNDSKN